MSAASRTNIRPVSSLRSRQLPYRKQAAQSSTASGALAKRISPRKASVPEPKRRLTVDRILAHLSLPENFKLWGQSSGENQKLTAGSTGINQKNQLANNNKKKEVRFIGKVETKQGNLVLESFPKFRAESSRTMANGSRVSSASMTTLTAPPCKCKACTLRREGTFTAAKELLSAENKAGSVCARKPPQSPQKKPANSALKPSGNSAPNLAGKNNSKRPLVSKNLASVVPAVIASQSRSASQTRKTIPLVSSQTKAPGKVVVKKSINPPAATQPVKLGINRIDKEEFKVNVNASSLVASTQPPVPSSIPRSHTEHVLSSTNQNRTNKGNLIRREVSCTDLASVALDFLEDAAADTSSLAPLDQTYCRSFLFLEMESAQESPKGGVTKDELLTKTTPKSGVTKDELLAKATCVNNSKIINTKLSRPNSVASDKSAGDQQENSSINGEDSIIRWKKGHLLGRGAFGKVWCGLTITGELIAVKQAEVLWADEKKARAEYDKIQEEVQLLKSLRHRNIVGYLGTSLEENVVSIFMQYVPGGTLASILSKFGPLPEPICARYTRQTLDGVAYLHSKNVIHRDIKGSNIMLMPNGVVKLIDFGCAKRIMNISKSNVEILKSMKGTPYWMAPEILNETGHGKKSDIWSLGCTVFEMLTTKPPWSHLTRMAAIYAIATGQEQTPELPSTCTTLAKDFVTACLLRDQTKRPSADDLVKHLFLQRLCPERILDSRGYPRNCDKVI